MLSKSRASLMAAQGTIGPGRFGGNLPRLDKPVQADIQRPSDALADPGKDGWQGRRPVA